LDESCPHIWGASEQSDGASAQALAQTRGVVDVEVIELAAAIEAALEDEGMKVRFEAQGVTEGLIGDDR